MRSTRHPGVAASVVVLCSALVHAQQGFDANRHDALNASEEADSAPLSQPSQVQTGPQDDDEPRSGVHAADPASSDARLTACLIIESSKNAAVAQLARQESQHGQIHHLAEQIIDAHEECLQKLQQIAINGGYTEQQLSVDQTSGPTDLRSPGNSSESDGNSLPSQIDSKPVEQRSARTAELDMKDPTGGSLDFIGLQHEVAEQCVESFRQELERLDEAEFDMYYVISQCLAHQDMIGRLEVFARHVSPDLRPTLKELQQSAQSHLDQANQIKSQLKKPPSDDRRESRKTPSKQR